MKEYFDVNRGLRQGCVMSQRLFNLFFDRVVRPVNVREEGSGVKLRDVGGSGREIKKIYIISRQRFHTLKHKIKRQEHYNISLRTLWTLELDLVDGALFPTE